MQAYRWLALVALALLGLAGISTWFAHSSVDRDEDDRGVIVVRNADGVRAHIAGAATPRSPSQQDPELTAMHLAAGSDAQLTDVRIVDPQWRIACGVRSETAGDRRPARVVWIGNTKTLVIDDGGADFERLARVCA